MKNRMGDKESQLRKRQNERERNLGQKEQNEKGSCLVEKETE